MMRIDPIDSRRRCLWAAAFVFVLMGGRVSRAASFECAKAVKPMERAICSDARLSAADSAMASAYRGALGRMSARMVMIFRADQVQWLAWAQQVCHAQDEKKIATIAECLQLPYADRVELLKHAVVRRDGVTFVTRSVSLAAPDTEEHGMGKPDFPGFGTLRASWPEADSTDPQWAKWHSAVAATAWSLASDDEDRKPAHPGEWDEAMAADADAEIHLRVRSVEHDRVTVTANDFSMGHGAAHPSDVSETLTWLLSQGRELRASDAFRPGGESVVARSAWAQLLKSPGKQYLFPETSGPAAKRLRDVVGTVRNWTLETDGLHISYPDYSVAPHVARPEDAVVPWGLLRDVLVPGFQRPE